MTGPEHYAEAERLAKGANDYVEIARATSDAENWPAHTAAKWAADHVTALAHVHATLALAAAQAVTMLGCGEGEPYLAAAWRRAVAK